ncbi:HAD hydrolase-like protein [Candidatus Dojkabacteria bacterium]|nr:HAD hydrolase-like protein [Candidatus Dojkabacteria bacterium]
MEYRGREYKVIIWDWLWTLYSRKDNRLFGWVNEYFETYGKDSKNFIISYANTPQKRTELIRRFGLSQYFEGIVIKKGDKVELFKEVIETYKLNKEEILVIGDNVSKEGVACKELGLDFIPIALWNEYVYTKLRLGLK